MKNSSLFVVIVAAIISMTAGIWLAQTDNNMPSSTLKPGKIQGAIFQQAKNIKKFNLQNHLNEKFTRDSFLNHWSLIFVGYTHCPDICPTTLAVMNQVDKYMREQQLQPPEIVFLSIDPERDSPESLNSYVKYFNEKFVGITGSIKEITQLSQQLSAVFRKAPGSSGEINENDYLMDHSSSLMLINPQGNLQSILTAPHLPGTIIESIIQSQAYY